MLKFRGNCPSWSTLCCVDIRYICLPLWFDLHDLKLLLFLDWINKYTQSRSSWLVTAISLAHKSQSKGFSRFFYRSVYINTCEEFAVTTYSSFIFSNTDYAIEDCLCSVGITAIILAMLCIICGDKKKKPPCKRWYNKVVFDNSQWLILWLCWTLSLRLHLL